MNYLKIFIKYNNNKPNLPINLLKNSYQHSNRRWYTPVGSHFSDNNSKILEKEKEISPEGGIKSILKHAPGWNETLASDSEAYVKADREPDSLSIEHLQNQTISNLIDKHKDEIDADVTIETDVHKEIEIHGHLSNEDKNESKIINANH